jgi:hypothetical protein
MARALARRGGLCLRALFVSLSAFACQGPLPEGELRVSEAPIVTPWSAVEIQTLEVAPGIKGSHFGRTMAMDRDYPTLAVGSPGLSWTTPFTDAVRVYTHQPNGWVLEATIPPPATVPKRFGAALAVSGDSLIVSATASNVVDPGRVWVFVRSGTSWTLEAELIPGATPASSGFGTSVDIHGDNAVVGAPADNLSPGHAYIFQRDAGSQWGLVASIPGAQNEYDFGASVAMYGYTLAVGRDSDFVTPRRTRIFEQIAGSWVEQASLNGFGGVMALQKYTLFIRSSPSGVGVTRFHGNDWKQGATLFPPSPTGTEFGRSLSIQYGMFLAVGEPDPSGGSVHLYRQWTSDTWLPMVQVSDPTPVPGDDFGAGVAMTVLPGEQYPTVIVGAPGVDSQVDNSGVAHVFEVAEVLPLGASCVEAKKCDSGFCVDGVCCNQPCDSGVCSVCSSALGANVDGACTPLTGTVCAPAVCAGVSALDQADVCDANGQCVPGGVELCGVGKICAQSACVAGCASNLDCAPGETCKAGACLDLAPIGENCSQDSACASGHCVDGTCCNQACDTGTCASGVCVANDAGVDAGIDAAVEEDAGTEGDAGLDAGTSPNAQADDEGSCGCRSVGSPGTAWPAVLAAALGLFALRRRSGRALTLLLGAGTLACGEREQVGTTSSAGQELTAVFEQTLTLPFAAPEAQMGTSLAWGQSRILAGGPYALNSTNSGVFAFSTGLSSSIWSFQTKLPVPTVGAFPNPGQSLAALGNTAIVGVPEYDVPSNVRIFQYVTNWSLTHTLTSAATEPGDGFGSTLAVDSQTLAVGSYIPAAVHLYSVPSWTPQATLPLANGPVAINVEGPTILAVEGWTAHVFEKSGSQWVQTAGITPIFTGALSAGCIAGTRILLGNSGSDEAYVYMKVPNGWTLEATLEQPGGESYTHFGASVALLGDRLFVGAPRKGLGTLGSPGYVPQAGAGYLYELSAGSWKLVQELQPPQLKANDQFGSAVLLGYSSLVVSAVGADDSGLNSGNIRTFLWTGTTGDPCSGGCASGFCVDGFCCDTSCGWGQLDDCVACSVLAGGTKDGTCSPVAVGTSCGAGFCSGVASMDPPNTCDTAGECIETPAFACEPGYACSAGACATSCDAGAGCLPGWGCAAGNCQPIVDVGKPCGAPAECATGHCVDGVCCDSSCGGEAEDCLACSVSAGGALDGVCGAADEIACNDGDACTLEARCEVGTCKAVERKSNDGCGEVDAGVGDAGGSGGVSVGGAAGSGAKSPGESAEESEGCGCAVPGRVSRSSAGVLLLAALAFLRRRRWVLGFAIASLGCASPPDDPLSETRSVKQPMTTTWSYDEAITLPAPVNNFGGQVALEGDDLFVTGGGNLYRFARVGDSWQLAQTFSAIFASSMMLAGKRLVVTHPSSPKHTKVLEPVGTSWESVATLADVPGDSGSPIGMGTDMIVVGERFALIQGVTTGAAWVFEKSGTSWGSKIRLDPPTIQAQSQFGAGVVVSGTSILVNAWQYDATAPNSGAVFVFEKGPGGWSCTQTLSDLYSQSPGMTEFGGVVALNGFDTGSDDRVVALYERVLGSWTLQKKLKPDLEPGGSPALAMTQGLLALGETQNAKFGFATGAVRLLDTTAGHVQIAQLYAPKPLPYEYFGAHLALSAAELAVGQTQDSTHPKGVVYLYRGLSIGGPCALTTDCETGFCVDGVCCDTACGGGDNDCVACSVATGAVNDGQCATLAAGTSCGAKCANDSTQQPAGSCDDAGACDLPPTQACAMGHACELGACIDLCTGPDDCLSGYFCSNGSCSPIQGEGAPCASDDECTTKHCVDGVCCDQACGNGAPDDCVACAIASGAASDGVCAALSGSSCIDYDPCTASAECLVGFCQPKSLEPDGTECPNGSCAAGVCSPSDAGSTVDAGLEDAAGDGATTEGASKPASSGTAEGGGCSCRAAATPGGQRFALALGLLGLLAWIRAQSRCTFKRGK